MTLSIENKTSTDLTHVEDLLKEFYPYAQQRLGFNKPVSADLVSDPDNAANLLGKTAHYSPHAMQIAVYVDGRHPKDILRSFSHELVHHAQNCRGEFDKDLSVGEGYAQKNEHMRLMEKEAYLEGQMILRDWEDSKKITKESKKMTEEQLRTKVRETIENVLREGEETVNEAQWEREHVRLPGGSYGRPSSGEVADLRPKRSSGLDKATCKEQGYDGYSASRDECWKLGEGKIEEEVVEEETVEEEITEEEVNEEEVVEENEEVNEEEALQESTQKWKDRILYETLMEKWCK